MSEHENDYLQYPISFQDDEYLEKTFTYHPPINEAQANKYKVFRARAKELACGIISYCPPSRERSLALTKIEESVMWANAAIARNEK